MAGWDAFSEEQQTSFNEVDFGDQPDVGEPGESTVLGAGADHAGSPYGQTEEQGAERGIPGYNPITPADRHPSTDRYFLQQAREKESASKGGLQGVWDKQKQEWTQAPGRKAAVSGAGSFIAAKAGLAGGPPGFFIGLGLDAVASALGLYDPHKPGGMGDTESWYGNNPPPTPDDPHGGGDAQIPQPKKRVAPKPVSTAGSGNKPDLLVRTRAQDRQAKRQITRRV
jgi:hypothetical protein